jgi:hypothetical protein
MHEAILMDSAAVIPALLAAKADVNAKSDSGYSLKSTSPFYVFKFFFN